MRSAILALCLAALAVFPVWRMAAALQGGARASAESVAQAVAQASPESAGAMLHGARDMLAADPLAAAPLAQGAFALAAQGRRAEADAAMGRALRRNPRMPLALAWAADNAVASGHYEHAVQYIDVLIRLRPEARKDYVAALAALSERPEAQNALLAALDAGARWEPDFVAALNQTRAQTPFAYKVNRLSVQGQSLFLEELARAGRYEEAYLAWLDYLPAGDVDLSFPYDGGFRGLPGAPPFNWRIDDAELLPGGGLYAVLKPDSGDAAVQTMLLPPGRYRLTVEATGETRSSGAGCRWIVRCAPTGAFIADLKIDTLSPTPQVFETVFTNPAGCPAQTLTLRSLPGALALWAQSTTRRVSIAPAEAVR